MQIFQDAKFLVSKPAMNCLNLYKTEGQKSDALKANKGALPLLKLVIFFKLIIHTDQ